MGQRRREDDFEPGREVKPWEPIAVKDVLIQFVVFDVLWADGVPVGDRPLEERKRMLEEIISPETADNPARLPVVRQAERLHKKSSRHACSVTSSLDACTGGNCPPASISHAPVFLSPLSCSSLA